MHINSVLIVESRLLASIDFIADEHEAKQLVHK